MAYTVKPKAKRQRVVAFPLVEVALPMWMKQASAQYAPVTGDIFQCVLFPCLNNWFLPSLLLNLAKLTTSPPPSHCSTKMLAEADRKRICELPEAFLPADIFNVDKTGLCYACTLSPRLAVAPSCYLADVCLLPRMLSDTGLAQQWRSGVKQQKLCLTYAFTVNADGTKMLELFVIGKLAKPVPFGRKSPNDMGFSYHYNIKAWMTSALFDEYALFLSLPCPCGPSSTLMLTLCPPTVQHRWLRNWDLKLRKQNRFILLLLDSFSCHSKVVEGFTNITLAFFLPSLTSVPQPLDQGIIWVFKVRYRR